MILKIKQSGEDTVLVSWMNELPKKHSFTESETGKKIRVNDIKRVLAGSRKTAGGYVWKSVEV